MKKFFQLLIYMSLLAVIPSKAAPIWSNSVLVPDTANTSNVKMCCDTQGNPIAVWQQGTNIYGSSIVNGIWRDPDQISTGNYAADQPQLCCYGPGQALVVWREAASIQGFYTIYVTPYTPGSTPSSSDRKKVDENLYFANPQICCDQNDHAIIVYLVGGQINQLLGKGYVISNQNLTPNASYISDTNNNWSVQDYDLCCDDTGSAIVTYTQEISYGYNPHIYGTKYTPWQTPAVGTRYPISNHDWTSRPHICCDRVGHAILIWYENLTQIYGAGYNSTSGEITDKQLIANTTVFYDDPARICCDKEDHAIIVWRQGQAIHAVGYESDTGTLTDTTQISSLNVPVDTPPELCCCQENQALIVYRENNQLWSAGYSPAESTQKILFKSLISSENSSVPIVTCCKCGAVALWLQNGIRSSFLKFPGIASLSQYPLEGQNFIVVHPFCGTPPLNYFLDGSLQSSALFPVTPGEHVISKNDSNGCQSDPVKFNIMATDFPWSDPQSPTGNQSSPQLCCASNGDLIAVWVDPTPPGAIWGSVFINGGWQASNRISPIFEYTPIEVSQPQVCCDNQGAAYVVWNEISVSLLDWCSFIRIAHYIPGHSPVMRTIKYDQTCVLQKPLVCCKPNGEVVVVWEKVIDDDNIELWQATYTGPDFPLDTFIDSNILSGTARVCCTSTGYYNVVWQNEATAQLKNLFDIDRYTIGSEDAHQQICCFNDHTIAVWSSEGTVRAGNFQDGYGDPIDVGYGRSNPHLCCDEVTGKSIIVWQYDGTIQAACYDPTTRIITGRIQISQGINAQNPIVCCCTPGKALVLYEQNGAIISAGYTVDGDGNAQVKFRKQVSTGSAPLVECCNCKSYALWTSGTNIFCSYLPLPFIYGFTETGDECTTGKIYTIDTFCGTEPLSYYVDGQPSTQGPSFTFPDCNAHTIQVKDFTGCESNIVSVPDRFVPNFSASRDNCNGTISITLNSITAGCPPYYYSTDNTNWVPINTFPVTVTASYPATLNLYARDSRPASLGGPCVGSQQVVARAPFNADIIFGNPQCDGQQDITLKPSGGSNSYLYKIDNGAFISFTGQPTITVYYPASKIIIRDNSDVNLQCAKEFSLDIPAPFDAHAVPGLILCDGQRAVTISATGGTPIYGTDHDYYYSINGGTSFAQFTSPAVIYITPAEHDIVIKDSTEEPYGPCDATFTFDVISKFEASVIVEPMQCGGKRTITLTASGGTPIYGTEHDYYYSLDGGYSFDIFTSPQVITLPAGAYTVIIKDATEQPDGPCEKEFAIDVNEQFAATAVPGPMQCDGQRIVTLSATGGTPIYGTDHDYYYSINGGTSFAQFTSPAVIYITPAEHDIVIKDSTEEPYGPCDATFTFDVISKFEASVIVEPMQCGGKRTITLTASGGTPIYGTEHDYYYSLDGGYSFDIFTSPQVITLPAGAYTVIIKDATEQPDGPCEKEFAVDVNDKFAATAVPGPMQCDGQRIVTLSASGGTPIYGTEHDYYYTLDDGYLTQFTSPLVVTLPAGEHTIVISDATPEPYGPCEKEFAIDVNDKFAATAVPGPMQCDGQRIVTLSASGGTPIYGTTNDYYYTLDDGYLTQFTSPLVVTLPAGEHTIVISDATPEPYGPCEKEFAIDVNDKFAATAVPGPMQCDGQRIVTLSATGGTPIYGTDHDYYYSINGGTSFAQFTSPAVIYITPAEHDIVIKDSTEEPYGPCDATFTFDVISKFEASVIVEPMQCGGKRTITLTASGGTPIYGTEHDYYYSLDGGYSFDIFTSPQVITLPAGAYTVIIKDATEQPDGPCEKEFAIDVNDKFAATAVPGPMQCDGQRIVTLSATGGTPIYGTTNDYYYTLDDGYLTQFTSPLVVTLPAGEHTIVISDATPEPYGPCEKEFAIDVNDKFAATAVPGPMQCGGKRTITLTASGGTPIYGTEHDYYYSLDGGYSFDIFTSPQVITLPAGAYTVIIKDATEQPDGPCEKEFAIDVNDKFAATAVPGPMQCDGQRIVTLTASGGTPIYGTEHDYYYSLDGGYSFDIFTSPQVIKLPAGAYTVIIKDATEQPDGPCEKEFAIDVNEQFAATAVPGPMQCDGQRIVTLSATGGTPIYGTDHDYYYSINGGTSFAQFTSPAVIYITPAEHDIVIKDSTEEPYGPCDATFTFDVISKFEASVIVEPMQCGGKRTITLTASGGTPIYGTEHDYYYSLDGGYSFDIFTSPQVITLPAGAYTVIIKDATEQPDGPCEKEFAINVNDKFAATAVPGTMQCDGQRIVTLSATGGTPIYGTTNDYYYTLDDGYLTQFTSPLVVTLPAGEHTIVISDATPEPYGPCEKEFAIDVNDKFAATAVPGPMQCDGQRIVTLTASGGTPIYGTEHDYYYSLDGGYSFDIFTSPQVITLPAGAYTVIIKDATEQPDGPCEKEFAIDVNDKFAATAVPGPMQCDGQRIVTLSASGGTPIYGTEHDYYYSLDGGYSFDIFTSPQVITLPAGAYTVIIKDATEQPDGPCEKEFAIDVNDKFAATAVPGPMQCDGQRIVTLSASGGTPIYGTEHDYYYTLDDGYLTQFTSPLVVTLPAGEHTIVISDATPEPYGPCEKEFAIDVNEQFAATAVPGPMQCDGQRIVTLSASGGTPIYGTTNDYYYTLDDGYLTQFTSPLVVTLPAGEHTIVISDATPEPYGPCEKEFAIDVNDKFAATAVPGPMQCDGQRIVTLSASGGTPIYGTEHDYYYSLDGGYLTQFTSPLVVTLPAGEHTIVISDATPEPYGPCEKEFAIDVNDKFKASAIAEPIRCDGLRTTTLTATGGTPMYGTINDYYYSIDGGYTFTPFTSPYNITLPAGDYIILIKDATPEPYGPCESEPVSVVVPEELILSGIDYPHLYCVPGPVLVTVHASGGVHPLHYLVDGVEQTGPTFTLDPHSAYTITVQDSREPYPCTLSQTITIAPQCPTGGCVPRNKLFLTDSLSHGAPIQAVAWSCPTSDSPYALAAIGGYKAVTRSCTAASLRVYSLDIVKQQLKEIFDDLPTDYVFATDWCIINGIAYLAVAGYPDIHDNILWIYKYDPQDGMLPVATFKAHNDCMYSVSWLCDDCNQDDLRTLAIGGESGAIRILQLDTATRSLYEIGSTSFSSTVYKVDWCKGAHNCNYLAAGGRTATDCAGQANIKFYNITCYGCITLNATAHYEGGTVRTLKWCCPADRRHMPLLAVGGDPITQGPNAGKNIHLYRYNAYKDELQLVASQGQPSKLFALEWLPDCNCSTFIAGSGCLEKICPKNIGVYALDRSCTNLNMITSKHLDDNITTLAACKIGTVTYILAGSESNDWQLTNILDPLCPVQHHGKELALYKGVFCERTVSATCKPTSICDRTHNNQLDE